jgi:hypothetical protein
MFSERGVQGPGRKVLRKMNGPGRVGFRVYWVSAHTLSICGSFILWDPKPHVKPALYVCNVLLLCV